MIRLSLACSVGAALVTAAGATAGPFVGKASKTRARPGDVVRVQAGAGLRFYALLPLYIACNAGAGGSVIAFDQGSSATLTVVR